MAHPLGDSRPVQPWRRPPAATEAWSRKEFAEGAQSGLARDVLTTVLMSRLLQGVSRRRR